MLVKDLIDYINSADGDIVAIRENNPDMLGMVMGVAGSTEDFLEEEFLPPGNYILFRAIETVKIN